MNKNLYDGTTSTLSVSSTELKHCGHITETLLKLGIMAKITPNKTIICNNNSCWIENGCTILLTGLNPKHIKKKVWDPLNQKYDLRCAHLKTDKQYQGCIYDFDRKSKCPGPDNSIFTKPPYWENAGN